MANLELDNEQVRPHREAVLQKLNKNSCSMIMASLSTRRALLAEREALDYLYEMLCRRQIS